MGHWTGPTAEVKAEVVSGGVGEKTEGVRDAEFAG